MGERDESHPHFLGSRKNSLVAPSRSAGDEPGLVLECCVIRPGQLPRGRSPHEAHPDPRTPASPKGSLTCVCLLADDRPNCQRRRRGSVPPTHAIPARPTDSPRPRFFPPALRRSKRPSRAALIMGFAGVRRRGHLQVMFMTRFVSATSEILPRGEAEVNGVVFFSPARVAATLATAPRRRPFSPATRAIVPRNWPRSSG